VYQRDPLSVTWDRAAGRLLGAAIARAGQWAGTIVPSRPGSRQAAKGGLTTDELAFQRAVFHPVNESKKAGMQVWSVQVRWGRREARGRHVEARVTPAAEGFVAAYRLPPAERYFTRGGKPGARHSGWDRQE
jgi:hypothetical protein